ncbi:MAG: TonB-dependent receptor plug domain-containing protein, partial [Flavisolibacter sp.]
MRRFLYIIACMLISVQLLAQTRVITGTITDNNGQALPYVNVKVSGGTAATTTNVNGVFTLTIPQNASKLEVSYVGYATQTVSIPDSGPVSISMIQTANALNEVVVTGYRNQKRSEYAGAVSKVDAKEVNHVPFGSFDQILQGRAAGLTVLSGSGQPGDAASVIIRGPTSIVGGNDPLYVVDGIPIEAAAFQNINPNDIASVDVLKDATAASLYGSRGAPGVIVISTKRGKAGRMKISYSAQYGRKAPPHFKYEMMKSEQLLQAQEDLGLQLPTSSLTEWGEFPNMPGWQYSPKNGFKSVNGSIVPKTAADIATSASQLDSLKRINTDWNDEFFRTGIFNNHEISFSGGTGKTLLYSNLSYYSEQGT